MSILLIFGKIDNFNLILLKLIRYKINKMLTKGQSIRYHLLQYFGSKR